MRRLSSLLTLLLLALGPSGCGSLLPKDGSDRAFFVLSDEARADKGAASKLDGDARLEAKRLLVRNTKANGFINSHKIIFGENPRTRGFYQLASWVEPPPERFTLLMMERFEEADLFASVSRLASSTLGDYQINTEITEFYHDISGKPGKIHIRVAAELIDLGRRVVLSSRSFTAVVPAKSYDVEGAVSGFNQATSQVLDEIFQWTSEVCRNAPA